MDGFGSKLGLLPVEAVVAIPIQNEAERIAACLAALSEQVDAPRFAAVLFLNNTVDQTADIIRDQQHSLSFQVSVVEHEFPPPLQAAGHARRMAMGIAAVQARAGTALLCTDADGRVAPDWLAANLYHLRAGVDAVAGRIEIDPVEGALIPQALHEADARECAYSDVLDELDSLLDPDPLDPWPRHTEHSGASICVTLDAFHRAGGIPAEPVGEDRAFFEALRRVDARVRHACDVRVTVSARLQGRAKGGMADTIRRRMQQPDEYLDDRLEPADMAWRRSCLRKAMRDAYGDPERLRHALSGLCTLAEREHVMAAGTFGALWTELQAISPALRREIVAVSDLPQQLARAQYLRDVVRRRSVHRNSAAFGMAELSSV